MNFPQALDKQLVCMKYTVVKGLDSSSNGKGLERATELLDKTAPDDWAAQWSLWFSELGSGFNEGLAHSLLWARNVGNSDKFVRLEEVLNGGSGNGDGPQNV